MYTTSCSGGPLPPVQEAHSPEPFFRLSTIEKSLQWWGEGRKEGALPKDMQAKLQKEVRLPKRPRHIYIYIYHTYHTYYWSSHTCMHMPAHAHAYTHMSASSVSSVSSVSSGIGLQLIDWRYRMDSNPRTYHNNGCEKVCVCVLLCRMSIDMLLKFCKGMAQTCCHLHPLAHTQLQQLSGMSEIKLHLWPNRKFYYNRKIIEK